MTLQLLHSEFPYIWGKFDFLFYQCGFVPDHWAMPRLTCKSIFVDIAGEVVNLSFTALALLNVADQRTKTHLLAGFEYIFIMGSSYLFVALALFRPQHSQYTCEGAIVEYVVRVANPLVHGVSFVPGHLSRLLVHPVVLHQKLVERFSDSRGTTHDCCYKGCHLSRHTHVLYCTWHASLSTVLQQIRTLQRKTTSRIFLLVSS